MIEVTIQPLTDIEVACREALGVAKLAGEPAYFKFNGVVVRTGKGRTWEDMANAYYKGLSKNHRDQVAYTEERSTRIEETLRTILDAVDYLAGNCKVNDPVGGVLPRILIERARHHLKP